MLMLAVEKNFKDCVKLLLYYNANVNETNATALGKRPLHIAAEKNHLECLDLLLANGALVNEICTIHKTALHYAVENNNVFCVRSLLNYGADITIHNDIGETPMHIAFNDNVDVRIIDMLRQAYPVQIAGGGFVATNDAFRNIVNGMTGMRIRPPSKNIANQLRNRHR